MKWPFFKLQRREVIMAGCAFLLAVIFIMDKVLFSGLRGRIRDLNSEITRQEDRFLLGRQMEAQKGQILQEYERYAVFISTEDSGREMMTRFLREVERLTQETGGSVISLTPKRETQEETRFTRYLADFQVEFTVRQWVQFLGKINDSELLIGIESFSLLPKTDKGDVLRFDAVISVTDYRGKE